MRSDNLLRGALGAGIALLTWLVLSVVLSHGAPAGVIVAGAVLGAIDALVAISIVLVYRANRVVNFAAAEFGSVAAVLAIEFHIRVGINYFASIAAGLVIAAVLGALVEATILRRFANAPRLVVAVATIGLAQVLNGISVIIPVEWSHGGQGGTFTTPWSAHFRIYPVVFTGDYVLAIVLVPIVVLGLAWFLRYTHYGVAIRAAADNGDRARLLGVPVYRLSTVVWAITGVLSALAVLLRVPILGFASFSSVSGGGLDILLQTLAAAVIAGMSSLPVTVAAAVGIGVAEQLGAWTFRNSTYVDAMLLGVILVALLFRRDRLTRAVDTGIGAWQLIRQVRSIPAELADLVEVRVGRRVVRFGMLALALLLPWVLAPNRTQLASLILIYGIVAASLVVLTGWAGHISLGQVAFMGFGGATTAVLIIRHGWDMFLALGVGMLVAALLALILGLPALRISGPFLAVVTLAFAVTSANYFLVPQFFPWFAPQEPIPRLVLFGRVTISSDREMYYLCLVLLVAVLTGVAGLRRSHAGRSMLAAKENRLATQSFGIDTTRVNLVAFAISGAIAGLAGGLFVIQQQAYNFSAFGAENGLTFFTMVVIGGLGSISGAVLGAVYVYGAQYLLPPGWSIFATGVGILVLLLFLPGGLGEVVFNTRDRMLRWVARRHDLVVPSLLADSGVGGTELLAVAAPARNGSARVSTNGSDGSADHAANGSGGTKERSRS